MRAVKLLVIFAVVFLAAPNYVFAGDYYHLYENDHSPSKLADSLIVMKRNKPDHWGNLYDVYMRVFDDRSFSWWSFEIQYGIEIEFECIPNSVSETTIWRKDGYSLSYYEAKLVDLFDVFVLCNDDPNLSMDEARNSDVQTRLRVRIVIEMVDYSQTKNMRDKSKELIKQAIKEQKVVRLKGVLSAPLPNGTMLGESALTKPQDIIDYWFVNDFRFYIHEVNEVESAEKKEEASNE